MSAKHQAGQRFVVLVAVSLFCLLVSPFIGVSMHWDPAKLVFGSGVEADIFWRIRVPRVLLGFLTGAALGAAGVVFQALFRNPLASPYTFGVASGASFGAALSIVFGFGGFVFGMSAVTIGGMLGALAVTLFISSVTSDSLSGVHMLLAGVAMSFFFSSLLMFMQYLSDFTESFQIVRWLMGGLETTDFDSVFSLAPIVLIGTVFLVFYSGELDAITTGDELAYSRGVDVVRTRKVLFFVSSLMVGAVVSFTGPIGFVGIMIPHFCRMLFGPAHRMLAPSAIIASGSFLIVCDALARVVVSPADLPVGIITSLLGGPFFIWVLLRRKGELFWV